MPSTIITRWVHRQMRLQRYEKKVKSEKRKVKNLLQYPNFFFFFV